MTAGGGFRSWLELRISGNQHLIVIPAKAESRWFYLIHSRGSGNDNNGAIYATASLRRIYLNHRSARCPPGQHLFKNRLQAIQADRAGHDPIEPVRHEIIGQPLP